MILGKDNSITLLAGDNEEFTVGANLNGVAVPLVEGDIAYFSVKQKKEDSTYIFQIVVDSFINGEAMVEILPNHTAELNGNYIYDVLAVFANGRKKHIIYPTPFVVEGGVFHG